MNRLGEISLGVLLSGFILILFGVIFTGIVADNVYTTRNTITITNETHAITNATTFTLTHDDVISVDMVANETVANMNVTTVSLDDGQFTLDQNALANITYGYYPDTYIRGSQSGRTLVNLTTLFFALAVVLFGVVIVFKSGIGEMFRK